MNIINQTPVLMLESIGNEPKTSLDFQFKNGHPEPKFNIVNYKIGLVANFKFETIVDEAYSSIDEVYDFGKFMASKDAIPLSIYQDRLNKDMLLMRDLGEEKENFKEFINKEIGAWEHVVKVSQNKECRTVYVAAFKGMVVGGFAGAFIGGICFCYGYGPSAFQPCIELGMSTGCCVGAAIGGAYGFIDSKIGTENMHDVFKTERFIEFINTKKSEVVDKIFKEFIHKNEFLKDCICPLSGNLFFVPVKAPNGITYEYDNIHREIRLFDHSNKSVSINHPFMSTGKWKEFYTSDLTLDMDTFELTLSKVKIVANVELHKLRYHDILQMNLTKYIENRNTLHRKYLGEMFVLNELNYHANKISLADKDINTAKLSGFVRKGFEREDLF